MRARPQLVTLYACRYGPVAVERGRATVATAPARPPGRQCAPHRNEFAARRAQAAPAEFASTSTAAAMPAAPASSVVRAGSPEPSASSREFASEFGG
jgi:hypothetical protein